MKHSSTFGKRKKLKVGDLVWWTELNEINKKNIGIIKSFKEEVKGGRKLLYAVVLRTKDNKTEEIFTAVLHKVEEKSNY
tara:strand:+ start:615 stop:851 length:237 start_codon:yes stop_codon:yes gene_type:complete